MGKKKVAQLKGDAAPKEGVVAKPATHKSSKKIESGRVYINVSYNNTVVTVTDMQGNVLTWASAGSTGFSGPKKATPFAASKIVAVISEKMKNAGITSVEIYAKGVGSGRDSAIRSLANQGFNVLLIKDITPIPHNGPRPPKVRRV